ncbi:hypothetical protein K445DRAFT_71833, partial [Daldinia sp. EC12]
KPSNSGELLKLLLPSYNRKFISGQTNYLCMVIMQEMLEKAMEYRGSKSITDLIPIDQKESVIVKEQRVDGGYTKQASKGLVLRCTLIGSERSP